MPLISQQILNILDGVSQQPDKLRAPSEGQSQINVFDSIALGKVKRPPTRHIAKLSNTPATFGGQNGAYVWPVNRDASERYHVIVVAGVISVFDANTGQQYGVLTPNGTNYLKVGTPPSFTTTITLDVPYPASYANNTPIESTVLQPGGIAWVQAPTMNSSIPNTGSSRILVKSTTTPVNEFGLAGATQNSSIIENTGVFINVFPPLADYGLTATLAPQSGGDTTWGFQFVLRGSTSGSNQLKGYTIGIMFGTGGGSGTTGSVSYHDGTGVTANIGSFTSNTTNWFTGSPYTLSASIKGNVITVMQNGIVLGTFTDTHITTPGQGGIYFFDEQFGGATPGVLATDIKMSFSESITLNAPTQFGLRFATVQDTTFIVNQSVTVEPLKGVATPTRPPEALIALRQIDYGVNYTVTLNGINFGFSTASPTTVTARQQLTTDTLTQTLATQIINSTIGSQFTIQVFGSTIYITRVDGNDFTLSVSDGLTDNAIVAIKGSIQSQALLPPRALNGFVVLVQPDPDNQFDATYYVYSDLGNPAQNGIWREAAAPGTLTSLDPNTMPWTLTRLGNVVAGFPADGGPTSQLVSTPFDPTKFNFAPSGTCVGDNGHVLTGTVPSQATGGQGQQIIVTYDVNLVAGPSCSTGNLPNQEYVTVQVTDSSQPGKTFQKIYYGGVNYPNEQIIFNSPALSGATISLTLLYSRQSTPPVVHQGNIYVHTTTDSIPGMTLSVPLGTEITLPGVGPLFSGIYPQGVAYTITANNGTFNESHIITPTSDQTNVQLATAIAAISWTHYTVTNPVAGEVTFVPASGSAPTVTLTNNWNQNTQYHNGNLSLATNSLVGFVIQDLTDGSSCGVVSNTSTTITCTGLSGGNVNKFLNNHLVSVTGPAGQLFFVFNHPNWTPRGVGDDFTNPFPSFTFNPIQEVGFGSGRLVFTSGENIIASGSDDVFDFFRTTVVTLLDSDRIDITANSQTVSNWHSIVHWAEGMWLWAGNIQAQLPTQPALANSTVSIQTQTGYQSSPTLRPLSMDRRVYFARERTGQAPFTQVFTYQRIRFPFFGFIAQEATKKVPTLLPGQPLLMVGDPTLELFFVLTDNNGGQQNLIFPYIFHYDESQQLQQESWSTWQLDPRATILGMDMLDGHLGLIVSRPDGIYLEDVDLQIALYNSV